MKLRYLLLPVTLLCSLTVSANGYLGFSFGTTSVKADLTSLGGGSIDESTGMSKLYVGYRLNKYVSAEAAWLSLASVSVAQVGSGPNAVSGSVDMSALGIYGVAAVPLTKRAHLLVKAGGAGWDADLQRDATTATADGFDAFYGLGLSYGFTKNLSVTADWEVINSPNPDLSTFSLGFKWEFK